MSAIALELGLLKAMLKTALTVFANLHPTAIYANCMERHQAFGVIETCGMPAALVAADVMGKSAAVEVVSILNTDSGRISVLIEGPIGAVKTAIAAATTELSQHPGTNILGHHIVPRFAAGADKIMPPRPSGQASENPLNWLDD